jgi:hypothetical protein
MTSLVYYNSKTFKPEPLLATSRGASRSAPPRCASPAQGVKFSDGSA